MLLKRFAYLTLCVGLILCFASCKDGKQDGVIDSSQPVVDNGQQDIFQPVLLLSHYDDKVYSVWGNLYNQGALPLSLSFREQKASVGGITYSYTVMTNSDSYAEVEIGGKYTFAVQKRDKYLIGTLTDNAAGVSEYYYSVAHGYERSWNEYVYPRAVSYANKCLEAMANGGEPSFYCELDEWVFMPEGNDAIKRLYEAFETLGDYKDSAEYLARFTVLRDMYVGTRSYTEYQHGNIKGKVYIGIQETVNYYSDGKVRTTLGGINAMMYDGDSYNSLRYIYDENGRLAKVQTLADETRRVDTGNDEVSQRKMLYYANKVTKELTLAYDENGVLVSGSYGDDSRKIIYKCDEKGRIVENNSYPIEGVKKYFYTYDENGRLTKVVSEGESWLHEYTKGGTTWIYEYDENGHLKKIQKTGVSCYEGQTYLEVEEEYVYETDHLGRVTKKTLTKSTEWDVLPLMYTEYIYQDLYFFE